MYMKLNKSEEIGTKIEEMSKNSLQKHIHHSVLMISFALETFTSMYIKLLHFFDTHKMLQAGKNMNLYTNSFFSILCFLSDSDNLQVSSRGAIFFPITLIHSQTFRHLFAVWHLA